VVWEMEKNLKQEGDEMMTDEEMMKMIDDVSSKFVGQLDDLQSAVGMVMMGRLYGWRVIRLVSSNRLWRVACDLFGDLKEFLPERGVLAHKSVGLMIVDKVGGYWDVIGGKGNRDALPLHERKKVA
jgi:hypothetical protein